MEEISSTICVREVSSRTKSSSYKKYIELFLRFQKNQIAEFEFEVKVFQLPSGSKSDW